MWAGSWLNAILAYLINIFRLLVSPTTSTTYLEDAIKSARTYEEWVDYQKELDSIQGKDNWFNDPQHSRYQWQALLVHKMQLENLMRSGNNQGLASYIRVHSSRNICRILSPKLYVKSKVQTKQLIHDYLSELRGAIRHLSRRESIIETALTLSTQDKRQLFSDVKRTLGTTTLLLQGGSAFSLCHLGVVKALLTHNLLPNVITGTATGALIAALTCTIPKNELHSKLSSDAIDLSAFDRAKQRRKIDDEKLYLSTWSVPKHLRTIFRRLQRFWRTGHLFDISVLRECAQDNFADLTFAEAYRLSGRVLNITVALPNVPGTPQLLNYITAPHVVISSAVIASIATSKTMYARVSLFCKTETGEYIPFRAPDAQPLKSNESPLARIGELFNVNHFVVSQTRLYIIPFIRLQKPSDSYLSIFRAAMMTITFKQIIHMLMWSLVYLFIPTFFKRILIDEDIPGPAHWSRIDVMPEFRFEHLWRVFEYPTAESVEEWSVIGERGAWPVIHELKVRCGVEYELDKANDAVRRRRPASANGKP